MAIYQGGKVIPMFERKAYLTIDTESPQTPRLAGNCKNHYLETDSVGKDVGIPLILRILREEGVQGTFFVNVYEDGYSPMRHAVDLILEDGHDVQLHTHPAWLGDRERLHMWQYSLAEQEDILGQGCEILKRWTGERPLVHRAGAYGANLDTVAALNKHEFRVDTSAFPEHQNSFIPAEDNTAKMMGELLELPIMTMDFKTWVKAGPIPIRRKSRKKKLDTDACSIEQLCSAADIFGRKGFPWLHTMLHSYSLVKTYDNFRTGTVHEKRCERLAKFIRYVSQQGIYSWNTMRTLCDKGEQIIIVQNQ